MPEQISYYRYIFDMGYPYYIATNGSHVVFSSDYGVCVITIQDSLHFQAIQLKNLK